VPHARAGAEQVGASGGIYAGLNRLPCLLLLLKKELLLLLVVVEVLLLFLLHARSRGLWG
jgi:hypothetical protein